MKTTAVIVAIASLVVIVFFVVISRKSKLDMQRDSQDITLKTVHSGQEIAEALKEDLALNFTQISLNDVEETRLVEIKDKGIIGRISQVIPNSAQVAVNSVNIANNKVVANANKETLYRAILPAGAKLDKSRAMENAFRGTAHGPNGYSAQANLVVAEEANVNLPAANVANAVSAAAGVAAIVVGQYYMTEINNQLGDINKTLDRVHNFQENEYDGRIAALIVAIQSIAKNESEILESGEKRERSIIELTQHETECTKLLMHANKELSDIRSEHCTEYIEYEKIVTGVHQWFQRQNILLKIMEQISELQYILNLGDSSRQMCYTTFTTCLEQSVEIHRVLSEWHEQMTTLLKIDVDAARRRKLGVVGTVTGWLADLGFDDEIAYKQLGKNTVRMIRTQKSGIDTNVDLHSAVFDDDVQIIAKGGKYYYLPAEKSLVYSRKLLQHDSQNFL